MNLITTAHLESPIIIPYSAHPRATTKQSMDLAEEEEEEDVPDLVSASVTTATGAESELTECRKIPVTIITGFLGNNHTDLVVMHYKR